MQRNKFLRRVVVVGFIVATLVLLVTVRSSAALCEEIDRVSGETHSGFEPFRGERVSSGADEWAATVVFDGADHCSVVADPARSELVCTWSYPIAEVSEARAKHAEQVATVRACFTDSVSETVDVPVNHPDFYEAVQFEPADRPAVSVALKNKSQLAKVLVTVSVSGSPTG